ncbi:unnamed protein product [Pleuronectes platessa]|uniref:Uncharacterized protein n=1 Tax=Pleuronectes platessa TaxID=8262 RepID=A0A9N7VFS0_PLEPL|nr:unnamed protein product [Pleuronectes platessa]
MTHLVDACQSITPPSSSDPSVAAPLPLLPPPLPPNWTTRLALRRHRVCHCCSSLSTGRLDGSDRTKGRGAIALLHVSLLALLCFQGAAVFRYPTPAPPPPR